MCRCEWFSILLVTLTTVPRHIQGEENVANGASNVAPAAAQQLPINLMPYHQQQQLQEDTFLSQLQQQQHPVITTTSTQPPPTEKPQPDYLKYCVNVDIELCQPQSAAAQAQAAAQHAANGSQPSLETVFNEQQFTTHQRDINACQCRMHPTLSNTWYCCNITHMSMISSCSNSRNWTNLHIFNLTINTLDLSELSSNTLHSLSITDGNITSMLKTFRHHSALKCLNISNNNISFISPRALSTTPSLIFLDISKNNLSRIPNWNQNQNITVDVSGNRHMLCDNLTEAIFSDAFQFFNPETSDCLYNSTYSWFNSTEYVSIQQLKMLKQFLTKCPVIPGYGNCTCKIEQFVIIQGGQSKSICHVDCSNLGLLELPKDLPDNTFSLNISNNKITSIGNHFNTNPAYQSIVKLIADNNQISSIYELEGTKFLEHFQRLYLRNNSLSKIPEYFLTNALVDRDIGGRIFLAGNKLQCDCNSAKTLKLWLMERSADIPDYTEVRCRNLPLSVMELQENKLCQSPHDWTDYIYYLIASEVLMLLLLVTKVSYDYWVFKTAGYLPWPASKMPKLPCDWLCET